MKHLLAKTVMLIAGMLTIASTACGQENYVGQKVAALDAKTWESSEWISVADAPIAKGRAGKTIRAADGANWFVATIKNEQEVIAAKWMTAGLGVYELYLNGQLVGEEVLKPGFTHFAKTKRSFTYNVTKAFAKDKGKENVLAAQVTPGWWADKIVTPGEKEGMLGEKCAFRGVLELTFADGTKKLFGTNCDTWKAGIAGPVKHAAIFDGETYDARELPGYAVVETLQKPVINQEFKGEILPSEGAEIYLRRDLALSPKKTYIWEGVSGAKEAQDKKEVEYGKVNIKYSYVTGQTFTLKKGETLVVDFGQNCSGVPAFTFKAKEGTQLTCLPAEILNDGNGAERRGMDGPEGSVHRRNLRIQDSGVRIDYTFGKDADYVNYYPHCTFFGYRYISVTAGDDVEFKKIVSIPITSIAQNLEIGTITTGNELINKLISNTRWGQRSNYLSVPTDCPQRDERLGWMADTQVFTEAGSFFANTDRFFHKWMRDVRDSQSETGGYPGVAPTAQYGNEMMRLGWADAGIIVPWTIWKQFGDKAIVDESWESMTRFMNHINEVKYNHEALVKENGNYQWADWLSCEALETCVNLAFDKNWKPYPDAIIYWNYLSASYWLIDAEMMRDMAKATGRDSKQYEQMAETARAYLKEQFLDKEGNFKTTVLNTMQTPALFALKNKLVEGKAKENVIARLRQNFAEHGNCLQTGFLGTSILMATLTENGMSDIAYELLFQRKNPSWIYSIDNGATTIWERWNSYTKDKGLGPNGMNSFNHYAYGAVCEWIWETAAGIATDVANPGFKHIIMKPIPDKRLGYIKAEYQSAAGLIKSAWRYEGNQWIWDFTIPEGATATVTLPGETTSKEYTSGTYQLIQTVANDEPLVLKSPDGQLEMTFLVDGGVPKYTLKRGNQDVILPSKMGFELMGGQCLDKDFILTASSSSTFDETWQPVWGEEANIRNHYNELFVTLQQPLKEEGKKPTVMQIRFRLYDDGLGFRYEFPMENSLTYFMVKEELTQFALTGDHTVWWVPGDYSTQEYPTTESKLSDVRRLSPDIRVKGGWPRQASSPCGVQTAVQMKTAEGLYINIHEAAVLDYPTTNLDLDDQTFVMTTHLTPDAEGVKARMQAPCKTPWRSIMVCKSATDVLASRLVLNLNDPCVIEDTSWIHPTKYMGVWWEMITGKSHWSYTSDYPSVQLGKTDYAHSTPHHRHGANNENVRRYIDFASENGFDALLIEGWNEGWEDWYGCQKDFVFDFITPYPDFDLPALNQYAHQKGIRLIMHHESSSSTLNYERWMKEAYDLMNKYGYDAVKSGYVGKIIPYGDYHYSQPTINHYHYAITEAAKRHIMVNAHEAVRPTGLCRTWPNMIGNESAQGTEFRAGILPGHTTILPFTRLQGGPMDYTPGIFETDLSKVSGWDEHLKYTICNQLALYVTFYSPLQMAADLPENYARFMDAFQFIKDVAVDWDKSLYLDAEPGAYIITARHPKLSSLNKAAAGVASLPDGKKDMVSNAAKFVYALPENATAKDLEGAQPRDVWYVGGITDEHARNVSVKLDFLKPGTKYEATIYADAPDADFETNSQAYTITRKVVSSKTTLKLWMARSGGFAISIREMK